MKNLSPSKRLCNCESEWLVTIWCFTSISKSRYMWNLFRYLWQPKACKHGNKWFQNTSLWSWTFTFYKRRTIMLQVNRKPPFENVRHTIWSICPVEFPLFWSLMACLKEMGIQPENLGREEKLQFQKHALLKVAKKSSSHMKISVVTVPPNQIILNACQKPIICWVGLK